MTNHESIRFGDGNSLTNFYSAANRLSGVRLPSGVALTNKYDFPGRLTNRVAKVNGAVVESASFDYNLNHDVTRMTDDPSGLTILPGSSLCASSLKRSLARPPRGTIEVIMKRATNAKSTRSCLLVLQQAD